VHLFRFITANSLSNCAQALLPHNQKAYNSLKNENHEHRHTKSRADGKSTRSASDGAHMVETTEQPKQSLLKFVVDNFAALSAIFSAVAASLSMVFIFGYLAVFNTSFIMILEYSDIIKFILIGICIGFGLLAAFISVINISISVMRNKTTTLEKVVMIVILFLFIVFPTMVAWRSNSLDLHYYVLRSVTGVTALGLLFFALRPAEFFMNITLINVLGALILLYFFVYVLRSTFGLYVDTDGTPHQITLRESANTTRMLSDAKLVLFTSHHIITKVGSEISVFQTADVLEITSPTKDWLPLLPFQ